MSSEGVTGPERSVLKLKVRTNRPFGWALAQVNRELDCQHAQWGEQDHDICTWMTILGEEFGEACKDALNFRNCPEDSARLIEELRQVSAVAVQIMAALGTTASGVGGKGGGDEL